MIPSTVASPVSLFIAKPNHSVYFPRPILDCWRFCKMDLTLVSLILGLFVMFDSQNCAELQSSSERCHSVSLPLLFSPTASPGVIVFCIIYMVSFSTHRITLSAYLLTCLWIVIATATEIICIMTAACVKCWAASIDWPRIHHRRFYPKTSSSNKSFLCLHLSLPYMPVS